MNVWRHLRKCAAILVPCVVSTTSLAQFASSNVDLKAQIDLAAFGSGSGNDCWGYVSPSGREYAIMGLNNKVAFVEVTNPSSPIVVASIPHSANLWGDIRTFGQYAYAVTELSGSGLQVMDLSLIDSGIVTLVRTLTSPGRTHTLAVDPIAGFLYTCGSNQGTGTTMCFSLADPSNPVRVGANSMTTNYQHAGLPVTYTSGALAGKTMWYGFSEGRGVDIYDFTNKAAPVKIATATYPNIGYCHQGWVSDDLKYLYVDDEFDEGNLNVPTRSLVFNVQDPYHPTFVGTFTSGEMATDHNQYWKDGFLFQANYKSGLRIFDTTSDPEHPIQTGWFDTYPEANSSGYAGAWSPYPYFPSGIVIISDLQRGLFIFDPTAAVTRTIVPVDFGTSNGTGIVGGLPELAASDDSKLTLTNGLPAGATRVYIELHVTGRAATEDPKKVQFLLEAGGTKSVPQTIRVWDYVASGWVSLDTRASTLADSAVTVNLPGDTARFVQPGTRELKASILWDLTQGKARIAVDQAVWKTVW